jgi:hypothetical protein
MSAATFQAPLMNEGAIVMNQTQRLTPQQLADLVDKVQALRIGTKMTGVFTSRRIALLLENLCTEDFVLFSKALQLKDREIPKRHSNALGVKRFDAQGKPDTSFNR